MGVPTYGNVTLASDCSRASLVYGLVVRRGAGAGSISAHGTGPARAPQAVPVGTGLKMPKTPEDEARLARERNFHNRRFGDSEGRPADRFYAVARSSLDEYRGVVMAHGAGRRALAFGAGKGATALTLARRGSRVTAIDISDVAVSGAAEQAERNGLADRLDFRVMDAEALDFPDLSFDLVFGAGILHHLDLDRAYREVARVLRQDGTAVFAEPLGHNPLIRLYRRTTPSQRTKDEHPLLMPDLAMAGRYFGSVETRFFHFASLAAMPFRHSRRFDGILRRLDSVDAALFKVRPARRLAWMVVIELSQPRSGTTA